MSATAPNPGLRVIFSVFLGLMLTAFVGVGVYTFHPPPDRLDERIGDLLQEEQEIRDANPVDAPSVADEERLGELRQQRRELREEMAVERGGWNLSTSIVLIVFSTLLLAASLLRPEGLPVIGNGLLLGGLFTMLYGVGWIASTETSITRFVVMTVALAITLGLGYLRFARRGADATGAALAVGDLSALEARIDELERRLQVAGRVLGDESGR